MVKGRGPTIFDSGVSLVTSSRSYADDDDLSFEPLVSSSKIKRISNTTAEDYNAIKGQSRRQDAALLNSITNRLDSNDLYPPVRKVKSVRSKVPSPKSLAIRRFSVPELHSGGYRFSRMDYDTPTYHNDRFSRMDYDTPTYHHALPSSVRAPSPLMKAPPKVTNVHVEVKQPHVSRTYVAPRPNLDVQTEVYSRPTTTASSPVTTRRSRPITTSSPVTTLRSTYRAASEPPRQTPGLSPSADQAVRQAKRSLYRIEGELGSGGSSPSYHYGGGGGGGYGYGGGYHHHHGGPTYEETVIRTSVPRTSSMHSVPRRSIHLGAGLRAGSLPPPSPRGARRGLPARTRLDYDIESDYEYKPQVIPDARPPPSLSGLRSRASEAKTRLDTHRSMLDRYLPVYMGPEPDVQDEVNYKYGELVQRIPRLDPYRPNRDSDYGSSSSIAGVTPYRRASLPPKPHGGYDASVRRPPMRPPVSEPRKRAREVLCKTKRDPHYFD